MARPMRNPFFKCPNCNALYQVIRGESGPETTTDREVPCRVCGALRVRSPPSVAKYYTLAAPAPIAKLLQLASGFDVEIWDHKRLVTPLLGIPPSKMLDLPRH